MRYIEYQEKVTRGCSSFPLEYHIVDETHPRYIMPYHWHIEHEIIKVRQGSLNLTVDGKNYIIKEGECAIIANETLHGANPHNCKYECMVFNLKEFFRESIIFKRGLYAIINKKLSIMPYFDREKTTVNKLTDYLFEIINKDGGVGNELIFKGVLFEIFGTIIESEITRPLPSLINRNSETLLMLDKSIEFIERNYQNKITLEDLSKEAAMSSKYYCRIFKEAFGKTPIEYLNSYRVELSCIKLTTTKDKITDIAYSCGFNDLSYFIKTFKHFKKMSPTQYLKLTNLD